MNSKKGNALIIILLIALVIVVGVGIYVYHKYRVSYEQVSALCAPGQFCSGIVSPTSVAPKGSYTMGCNYGYVGNGIIAAPGSGSCTYKGFSGTTAEFNCTAGTVPGTFSNSCKLNNATPYKSKINLINTLTVGCAPGQFCSGIVSPTSVAPKGSYTMGCNYGYVGNGIIAAPGSGSCTYKGFSGTTAEFNCTAGTVPGTFSNSCKLNNATPYNVRTDTASSITVVASSSSPSSPNPTSYPVTIPSGATAFLNLQQDAGWTMDASAAISPNPPSFNAINPAGGGGSTMELETRGTPGKYTGWMTKNTITKPSGDLHMLVRASYTFSSVSGIQAWEVGRRSTNAAGITDNGQTQLVPIGGGKLEFDIVPSASGGWKDTGCRFPTFVAGKTYNEELYYIDDPNGALSLEYVSLNGTLCTIPSSLQHIAGSSIGWTPNSAVMAFQPDANPTAVAYNALVTMSAWTWASTSSPSNPNPISTSSPLIPPNAIAASNLDDSSNWIWNHDPGTPGNSVGTSALISSPSLDGQARKFYDTYTSDGGEIYHLSFANDPNATHFVYDAEVYLADPASVANLEMDMNQVLANGKTVIYGTQCASGSKTWEYTYAGGWHASNISCNPTTWSRGWHHVQIGTERNSVGVVTYDWVDVDGTLSYFSGAASGPARSLGWSPGTLLINFQLDGKNGSGAITAYADKITVWRW